VLVTLDPRFFLAYITHLYYYIGMNFDQRNHAINLPEDKEVTTCWEKLHDKWLECTNYKGIWYFVPFGWKMRYYDKIRPLWNDENKRVRKSIPRTWKDISSLMVDVNFEMIKTFYEEEFKAGIVNWECTEGHKEFSDWIEYAYNYITKDRPAYEQALEDAYPPSRPFREMFIPSETDEKTGKVKMYKMVSDGIPYKEKYGEVDRLEALIDDLDTRVLVDFAKYRGYFWT